MALNSNQVKSPQAGVHADGGATWSWAGAAIGCGLTNAIAEAYIDDQFGAKYQTVTRAGAWLQDRINELKSKAAAADRAVLEFKEKNNIVDLGGPNVSAGSASRLIGEQQLFELNSQLAAARGATSEAKAWRDRIEQVRKMDVSEGAVADILKNEVIPRLRNQYVDLPAREANISTRYGADHTAAINLRDQMEETRRNIRGELGRIAGSYKSDYEIAKTREESLERSLASLVSEGQLTNRDRLGLAELESSAKVYHTLYDTFLQRYMEAIQQQAYRSQYGSDFISVTPTNLYGPGDNYHPELSHVVAALIRRFHEAKVSGAKSVIVWGTGTPRREFLYVDDTADACVHLMKTYSSAELVNIGTGEDITIASALHRPIRDTIEADLCCCVRIPAGWYRHLWPDPTGTFDLNQAGIG